MINEIDILHERHSCDFTCHAGKKTAGMFCVVSYHHKIIVELGEYGFYAFAESLVCPYWRTPVFLVQPIWDLKSNFSCFKEIFLHLSAEIAFVTKHHAVVIFPANILEIMEVMNACRRHVIRMYDTAYAADCMELISIIVQPLRGAISPVRGSISIVTPHCTTLRSCVLTDLYGLGINTEHIFGTVNGDSHILANFFGKPCRQLTSDIELPAAYKVGQIVLALMVQTVEKEIFTVESKSLSRYAESHDLEIGELWNNTTSGHISEFIHSISGEILADSEDSDFICYEVAHKQINSIQRFGHH